MRGGQYSGGLIGHSTGRRSLHGWGDTRVSPPTVERDRRAATAASRKEDKYVDLGARYISEPIAVETLGVFNASARHLLADLERKISINTRQTSYLFQRISVLVQRFNAVLLHDILPAADCTD